LARTLQAGTFQADVTGRAATLERIMDAMASGAGLAELDDYLRSGGDPNARARDCEWTLLHVAAEHMNVPCIEKLVSAGAELDVMDAFGETPLHVAVDIDIDSVVQEKQSDHGPEDFAFTTTLALLRLGADPGVRDHRGRTCRDWVEGYGDDALRRFDELTSPRSGPAYR
jgi:ankyrin repeat protein